MSEPLPAYGAAALALYAASGGAVLLASRALRRSGRLPWYAMPTALLLLAAGLAADLGALWGAGLRPTTHAYASSSYALFAWQAFHLAIMAVMAGYVQARLWAGKLDGVRRLSFDNVMLFWLYTAGQGAAGLALLHGFPWLLA